MKLLIFCWLLTCDMLVIVVFVIYQAWYILHFRIKAGDSVLLPKSFISLVSPQPYVSVFIRDITEDFELP